MNLTIHGFKMIIFGLINKVDLVNKKKDFFEKLHQKISSIGSSREGIILGDLNRKIGNKIVDNIVGKFGENIINDNSYG